jgi:hypothetical protein
VLLTHSLQLTRFFPLEDPKFLLLISTDMPMEEIFLLNFMLNNSWSFINANYLFVKIK